MGQGRSGTEQGPDELRENGVLECIKHLGNKVTDYGDMKVEEVPDDEPWNNVKKPRTVGKVNKQLAEWVEKIIRDDQVALTLGGDHSIAIGSIFGHAQVCPNLVVIWIDAHADINTPLSSPSGNIHGMPLSFVIQEMKSYCPPLPGFDWCKPCISARDLAYIGLRDVDEAERTFISMFGIKSYSMQEVDQYGLSGMLDRLLRSLDPSGNRPIHLSFDVDAMDPEFAPSTGTPVPGGLTQREMFYIAETIANTGRLSCLDVVEVNPSLGSLNERKITIKSTAAVVSHFFGKKREGNVQASYQIPMPKAS